MWLDVESKMWFGLLWKSKSDHNHYFWSDKFEMLPKAMKTVQWPKSEDAKSLVNYTRQTKTMMYDTQTSASYSIDL